MFSSEARLEKEPLAFTQAVGKIQFLVALGRTEDLFFAGCWLQATLQLKEAAYSSLLFWVPHHGHLDCSMPARERLQQGRHYNLMEAHNHVHVIMPSHHLYCVCWLEWIHRSHIYSRGEGCTAT